MATLRLFANLREIAGAGEVDVSGATVADVLAGAIERFGPDFERAAEVAQVWVDGDQADPTTAVASGAEVALIPPVSGGAMYRRSGVSTEVALAVALIVALFVTNAFSVQWLAVATVGTGALWVYDLVGAAEMRGMLIGATPGLISVIGSVLASYRFGAPGLAIATAGSVIIVLLWGVVNPYLRSIETIAASVSVSTTAAIGSGSIILLRLTSEEAALAFLVSTGFAVAVSWVSDRSDMPVLDPLVAMIVAAITAGAIAGALWTPDLLSTVAASVAGALALVAGRNLGTLLRAGGFFTSGAIPGSLHYLDGVFMASGPFWLFLTILI